VVLVVIRPFILALIIAPFLSASLNAEWIKIEPLRSATKGFLGDIISHCPTPGVYADSDIITTGHETLHCVNARIRNTHQGYNGYYFLENYAFILKSPPLTLSEIATNVPQDWRGPIYSLYLVEQQSHWNDTPLYIVDEFSAYLAGTTVGLEVGNQDRTQQSFKSAIEMYAYCRVMEKLAKQTNYADQIQLDELMSFSYERLVALAYLLDAKGWYTDEHNTMLLRVENQL